LPKFNIVEVGTILFFSTTVQKPQTAIRLDAQGISKSADGTKILSDISLSVHPGEFIGLLGPSGAGKSTLLNALNGFRPADQGRVLLNGTNLYEQFDRFRSLLGYVPQDDIVHTSLSVYRALYYSALLRFPQTEKGSAIKQKVMEIIRTLGLEAQMKIKVKRLSGGQRKRVSLGIELLTSPPLLFLDEPTSGLDPGLEERMMQLFHKLAKEGRTVIITTHIMESLHLLDLVGILSKGWLVFYGPPDLALKAFKVEEFSDIYTKLERFHPAELAHQYRISPIYKKYVMSRLAQRYKTDQVTEQEPAKPRQTRPLGSSAEQSKSDEPLQEFRTIEEELERLKKKLREK
jgi:ABC-type multidrug transport system ATPase subunit